MEHLPIRIRDEDAPVHRFEPTLIGKAHGLVRTKMAPSCIAQWFGSGRGFADGAGAVNQRFGVSQVVVIEDHVDGGARFREVHRRTQYGGALFLQAQPLERQLHAVLRSNHRLT